MKQSALHKMTHLCQNVFDAYGLSVDEAVSIADFESRMSAIGKPPNARTFNSEDQIIPEHRSLAIILRAGNQDIGGLLARHLDLGRGAVERLLMDEQRVLYGFQPSRRPSPTIRAMKGNVAYMGELWVREDGDWRGRPALAGAMVRYMKSLAFSRWELDWIYSVMKKSIRENSDRVHLYGFSVVEAMAQDWDGVSDIRRDSTEYFMANSDEQFEHHVEVVTGDPIGFFPGYDALNAPVVVAVATQPRNK